VPHPITETTVTVQEDKSVFVVLFTLVPAVYITYTDHQFLTSFISLGNKYGNKKIIYNGHGYCEDKTVDILHADTDSAMERNLSEAKKNLTEIYVKKRICITHSIHQYYSTEGWTSIMPSFPHLLEMP
jgi:hypothetical protein